MLFDGLLSSFPRLARSQRLGKTKVMMLLPPQSALLTTLLRLGANLAVRWRGGGPGQTVAPARSAQSEARPAHAQPALQPRL